MQGRLKLHSEFQTGLVYKVRPCLKSRFRLKEKVT